MTSYFVQRRGSKASMAPTDSHKSLISLLQSNRSLNNSPSGLMSESEARTIACDFDYGVQVSACARVRACVRVACG